MAQSRWRGPVTGGAAPAPAPVTQIGQTNHAGPGAGTPVQQYPVPVNIPPGAVADPTNPTGIRIVDQAAYQQWWRASAMDSGDAATREMGIAQTVQANAPPQPDIPTDPMQNRPATALTPQQALSQYGASVPAFEGAVTSGMFGGAAQAPMRVSQTPSDPRIGRADMGGVAPGVAPAAEQGPAEVDRARIDALLNNTSKATSGLMALGQRDLAFSQAQAQLRQGLEQGQRQALSLARSGNRRDRAANESRAIQAGTELAAQTGQAAAGLRATEEAAQQQIRLDAYKAAGDLGLNAGALDLNVQQLDMNAATNFLNQLFQRENLQLQIDQQEAERVTNFVRDMALIEKDYYALSQAERDAVRQDLTRRYGISEQTRIALTQLDKSDDINWGQLAISGIGGLITGSAQVGAALATKSATGGAA